MDKKYHRGGGEVVIPNKDIQPSSLTHFISIIQNLPVYAYCDPTLPVGWIEGEERHELVFKYFDRNLGEKTFFITCTKDEYKTAKPEYRRIWITPKTNNNE